jgi:hypothetical protein
MRFMMVVKATRESEAGALPGEKILGAMAKFNETLQQAGVLLDLSGLKPSSQGARVTFTSGKRAVTDGPFAETKELIAGYWLIQARSLAEAVEWAKRAPMDADGQDAEIEIRPLFELEDFAPGDAVEHHRRIGQELAKHK